MFYSYTGSEQPKIFPILILHSPSYKCSSILVVISQNYVTKRVLGCKKREKREEKKKRKKERESIRATQVLSKVFNF
jgi:hypothetical protein